MKNALTKFFESKRPMNEVINDLKTDKDYRYAWQANIAMAYIDCERWYKERTGKTELNNEDKHAIANEAADYFLKLLCDEIDYPEGR